MRVSARLLQTRASTCSQGFATRAVLVSPVRQQRRKQNDNHTYFCTWGRGGRLARGLWKRADDGGLGAPRKVQARQKSSWITSRGVAPASPGDTSFCEEDKIQARRQRYSPMREARGEFLFVGWEASWRWGARFPTQDVRSASCARGSLESLAQGGWPVLWRGGAAVRGNTA